MMKGIALSLVFCAIANVSFARDVHVNGYHRKDGTYVQPHIRSSPDSVKWNNYGPSNGNGYASPNSRDSDHDGLPNFHDRDDDNDGYSDDSDNSQYGR